MAKLTRVTQPIFASDAAVNETSVFGTMKTSAQYTANIADSINTVAFTKGWSDAVELDYAPYMEDMNTVQRAVTYQIAYNQQEGIPEWASDTTYYKGSWAKYNAANGAQIYESLVDNNTGNLVSDTTKWKLVYDTTNSAITSIVGANLTASRALVSNGSGKVAVSAVTATELGYLSGVTSAIQTQINAKAADNAVVHLSGTETITGTKTFTSSVNLDKASPQISMHNESVTKGTYPTSGTYFWAMLFGDKDNISDIHRLGSFNTRIQKENNVWYTRSAMTVYKNALNSTDNESIMVCYPESGNPYTYAPASDVINSIVTTLSKTKANKGHFWLGNGMLINWGKITATNNNMQTVSFDKAYSAIPCVFFAYNRTNDTQYSSMANLFDISAQNTSTTGFKWQNRNIGNDVSGVWFAIGYRNS